MIKKFILTLLLLLPLQSSSFSNAARLSFATNGVPGSLIRPTATPVGRLLPWSMTLMAKRRRRRKTDSPSPSTAQSDSLPDFDDGEADIAEEAYVVAREEEPMKTNMASMPSAKTSTPIKRGAGLSVVLAEEVGGNVEGLDEDTILGAMRGKAGGKSWQPPQSIQDTLRDRSLEKFMDFDKMIEQDGGSEAVELPDFEEVINRRKQREAATAMQEGRVEDAAMLIDTSGMGKKAAKNAQRKAAAMQREKEIEEEKSPFEDLNILKLLENGAWAGIILLVVWELYINSPFFDRAAPLIPAVFE